MRSEKRREKQVLNRDGGGRFFPSNNGVLLIGVNWRKLDGATDGASFS
jgi:hypothetical protein